MTRRAKISVPATGRRNVAELLDKPSTQDANASSAPQKAAPKRRYEGTYRTTLYIPEAVHEVIRRVAFDHRVKEHDLFLQGIDLMLAQHGQPSIAEITSSNE